MIECEDMERSHSGQSRVARYQESSTQAEQSGARLGWPAAGRAGAGRWKQQGGSANGPQGAASGLQVAACRLQEGRLAGCKGQQVGRRGAASELQGRRAGRREAASGL
ncbi:unnamed protein product [Closterium sp. NIES-54]